jgi:Ohr subfamily peroxiredoxin
VKVLYTARATVTGGRDAGHGRTSDGALDVQLRVPTELGGDGGGTNPEQLFAIGYAACFEGAIKTVARREKLEADDVSIEAEVSLGPNEDRSFIGRARRHVAPARRGPGDGDRRRGAPRVPVLERDAGQRRRRADGERPAARGGRRPSDARRAQLTSRSFPVSTS